MTRRLTLLRHAKAAEATGAMEDFDRPLAARGERDTPLVAAALARCIPRPQAILASPAARAWATAALAAKAWGLSDRDLRRTANLYEADPEDILAVVQALPASITEVLVVGHNPGMKGLVSLLTAEWIDSFPTCAAACLELQAPDWSGLKPGSARLAHLLAPRTLADA